MSKRTLSIGLFLAPLLVTPLAAAQAPAGADEPRETTANPPQIAAEPAPPRAPVAAAAESAAEPPPGLGVRKPAQPASSELHTVSHWYGWQILATDGAALTLSIAAIAANGGAGSDAADALGYLSLATYLGGGPTVHFAHGNVGKGLGSLALRAGLPILGGVVGAGAASSGCGGGGEFCGLGGAFLGGLIGFVGAMVVDSAVLGREQVIERASSWPIVGVASDGKSTLLTAHGRF